jgi:hypothetical protein
MPNMLTAKEVATRLDTDARTLRKFLRSTDQVESPGKGSRYSIEAKAVRSLKKGFDAWIADRTPTPPNADEAPDAPEGDAEVEAPDAD